MSEVKLSEMIAKCYWDVHRDIVQHRHTHYWHAGGRGSGKSSFVSLEIPLLMLANPDCHVAILRKVGGTLKSSVYPQVVWALNKLGIAHLFSYRSTPAEITYKKTGQKIMFLGVDDPIKIKSIKAPFGYIGVVWYEELAQFAGMEEIRSVNQSLMRGGSKYWCFATYNPPKSKDSWVNKEILLDDADRLVSLTDYTMIPPAWIGEQFIAEAEKLKGRNEMLYRHEYLGEVTGSGGGVFDNVADIRLTDAQIDKFDRRYYGLDYGFAVDPLAFVAMYYDSRREDLYIFDEVYSQRLSNKRAVDLIKPIAGRGRVIADSAEPKSIAEMRELGLNIYGAKKGADSIDFGISWLQHRAHIYIDKARCPNTYREFVSYEYAQNRQGEFISAYPDKDNHCVTGDTEVITTDGVKRIADMVGTVGEVYCMDESTGGLTVGAFFDCRQTNASAEVFIVEMEDGRQIKATAEHPVYTQRGWVTVGELTPNDSILDFSRGLDDA